MVLILWFIQICMKVAVISLLYDFFRACDLDSVGINFKDFSQGSDDFYFVCQHFVFGKQLECSSIRKWLSCE